MLFPEEFNVRSHQHFDDMKADLLKMSTDSKYWDMDCYCKDGLLKTNRFYIGLIFPQVTDHAVALMPDYRVQDVLALFREEFKNITHCPNYNDERSTKLVDDGKIKIANMTDVRKILSLAEENIEDITTKMTQSFSEGTDVLFEARANPPPPPVQSATMPVIHSAIRAPSSASGHFLIARQPVTPLSNVNQNRNPSSTAHQIIFPKAPLPMTQMMNGNGTRLPLNASIIQQGQTLPGAPRIVTIQNPRTLTPVSISNQAAKPAAPGFMRVRPFANLNSSNSMNQMNQEAVKMNQEAVKKVPMNEVLVTTAPLNSLPSFTTLTTAYSSSPLRIPMYDDYNRVIGYKLSKSAQGHAGSQNREPKSDFVYDPKEVIVIKRNHMWLVNSKISELKDFDVKCKKIKLDKDELDELIGGKTTPASAPAPAPADDSSDESDNESTSHTEIKGKTVISNPLYDGSNKSDSDSASVSENDEQNSDKENTD